MVLPYIGKSIIYLNTKERDKITLNLQRTKKTKVSIVFKTRVSVTLYSVLRPDITPPRGVVYPFYNVVVHREVQD